MRYWKVIESHSENLIAGKIYESDENSENLEGEYNHKYYAMSIDNGDFMSQFQEVSEEDYENQCILEEESNIHPKHYQLCSVECIDVMLMAYGGQVVYDFCMCYHLVV